MSVVQNCQSRGRRARKHCHLIEDREFIKGLSREAPAGRGQKVRTDLKWYVHKGGEKNSANVHEKTLKDISLYMQLAYNFS